MRPVISLLLAAACAETTRPPAEGIAVGNPTNNAKLTVRLAPDPTWVAESATWVATLSVIEEAGGSLVLHDGELDLLTAEPMQFSIALWDRVRIDGASKLQVRGSTLAGESVHLVLDLVGLEITGFDAFGSGAFVGEIGRPGWLGVSGDDRVSITPGAPEHDALATALVVESNLFPDANADGLVSDDERATPLGEASLYDDPENDVDDD